MKRSSDRRHRASRLIEATPEAIYEAFVDRDSLGAWLPPAGAVGTVEVFEPRVGGRVRMRVAFASAPGKTSDHTDVVEGRYVDLVPGRRIVQAFGFVSDDPAFAGLMTMTWTLDAMPEGTAVAIVAEDVPVGISRADHEAGMASSLRNLAAFVEAAPKRPS